MAVDRLCIVPSLLFYVFDCGAIDPYERVGFAHCVLGFAVDFPESSVGENVLSVDPLIFLQR